MPRTKRTPKSCMLVTGEYFDHTNPRPSVITLDVLEAGMRMIRFNGQTTRTITLGEHSCRVARFARELGGNPHTIAWAYLHDGHEPLVPWGDCLRPGKTDEMRADESRVDGAILAADFALPIRATSIEHDLVKTSDEIALYFEAMMWQPVAFDWAPSVWPTHAITGGGERHRPSRGDLIERFMPLVYPRPGECWRTEVEAALEALR